MARRNLCDNPSIEASIARWADQRSGSVTLNDLSRSSSWSSVGSSSGHYKVTAGATAGVFAQVGHPTAGGSTFLTVSPSTDYALSVRLNVITKPANGQKAWLSVFNGSGTFLGQFAVTAAVSATGLVTLSQTVTLPATAARAVIVIGNNNGAPAANPLAPNEVSEFYWDAVLLEQASSVGTYFDGSLPGFHWAGAANASVSVENTNIAASFSGAGSLSQGGAAKVVRRISASLAAVGTFTAKVSGPRPARASVSESSAGGAASDRQVGSASASDRAVAS